MKYKFHEESKIHKPRIFKRRSKTNLSKGSFGTNNYIQNPDSNYLKVIPKSKRNEKSV
jgi:hypothetical protein